MLRLASANGAAPSPDDLARFGKVVSAEPGRGGAPGGGGGRLARPWRGSSAALPVADLTVEDPPLEEVFSELFRASKQAAEG